MVDALLSAAAESDCSLEDMMMSGMNVEFSSHHEPPVRFCEFCNSSNTPTWRRGPAGKGSLCNACGIKWRLRKRLKKNEKGSPLPSTPEKKVSPSPVKIPKKRKNPDLFVKSSSHNNSKIKEREDIEFTPRELKRKKYYCKYCDQTFSLSQFRNSQQFGAHCSNCSRRPRNGEEGFFDDPREFVYDDYSPVLPGEPSTLSSPESPQTNSRDGLLLRLLHVVEHQLVDVHELAQVRDELSSLKSELLCRDEARKAELGIMKARLREDIADLKAGLNKSVAAHEQLAARRLMEMEQTIRMRAGFAH